MAKLSPHSPHTSEVGSSNPRPYVRKFVDGQQFTVQNLDQMYVLVCPARHEMTYTVLKAMLKPKIFNEENNSLYNGF